MIRVNVTPVAHRWRRALGPVYACVACSAERVVHRPAGQYVHAYVRRAHVGRPGVTAAGLRDVADALGLRVLSIREAAEDEPAAIIYQRGRRGCRVARRST